MRCVRAGVFMTGPYRHRGVMHSAYKGIIYDGWKGPLYSLRKATMAIKPAYNMYFYPV